MIINEFGVYEVFLLWHKDQDAIAFEKSELTKMQYEKRRIWSLISTVSDDDAWTQKSQKGRLC